MDRMTTEQIASIAETIRTIMGDDEDDALFFDTLEGETDVMEWAGRLVIADQEAKAMAEANKALAAMYAERKARFDRKSDACRAGLGRLLDAIGTKKLPLVHGTVTRTKPRQRAQIEDETAIPSQLCKRVPDAAAVKAQLEAGESVPGARLVTGEPGIMVRVK